MKPAKFKALTKEKNGKKTVDSPFIATGYNGKNAHSPLGGVPKGYPISAIARYQPESHLLKRLTKGIGLTGLDAVVVNNTLLTAKTAITSIRDDKPISNALDVSFNGTILMQKFATQ
jgi:hypothetical protein